MAKLQQHEVEELRERLETEKVELEDELSSHGRILNDAGDWEGASVGFEGQESDPNDVADQIEEFVTNVPLVAELEEKHVAVAEALEKIDEGVYGLCEECSEPIPYERLKASPSTRTCIEHAEEEEVV